jgi:peroxiredoxin
VVLAFFKTTCPTCQYAFPFLERLKGDTPLFAVSQDDAESTRQFHAEFGITLPTLLDSAGRGYPASNAYGITYVPSLFLVEPDGRISWASTGFHKSELEELGRRLGVAPFRPGENVPEWKAG